MPYYYNKKQHVTKNKVHKKKRDLVKKLDRIFSLYIRLRDAMPNGYTKCISCGKIKSFKDMDCGHFFSRRHMATRFDEDNAHSECAYCNRFRSDHLVDYQINLIRKIGQNRYEKLKIKANTSCHFLDCELEGMISYYIMKIKEISTQKDIKVK